MLSIFNIPQSHLTIYANQKTDYANAAAPAFAICTS